VFFLLIHYRVSCWTDPSHLCLITWKIGQQVPRATCSGTILHSVSGWSKQGYRAVCPPTRQQARYAQIVPLKNIHFPCHVSPLYMGSSLPSEWVKCEVNTMDTAELFVLNPFSSLQFHAFMTLSGIIPLAESSTLPEITEAHVSEVDSNAPSDSEPSSSDSDVEESGSEDEIVAEPNPVQERPNKRRRMTQAQPLDTGTLTKTPIAQTSKSSSAKAKGRGRGRGRAVPSTSSQQRTRSQRMRSHK